MIEKKNVLGCLNKLQKFEVRQRVLFIVMIFRIITPESIQFVFIVRQAQVIDVVVLFQVNKQEAHLTDSEAAVINETV